ncbi:hypothetical protein BGW38_002819, partial [Lunasporangiospora selenospora]
LLDSTLYASLTSPGRGCQHDQTAFLKDFDDEEDDGDDDEEDEDNDDGEKGIPDNSHDARKPDPHIFSGVSVIPRVPVMTSLALSPIDRPLPESDSNLVSFQKPSRGEKECTKDQRISEDSSKTNPVAKGDRSTSNNALPLDRRHLQGNRQSLGADVLTKPQASGPIGETHQRTTRPWSHVIWESPKMDTLSLYRSAAPQQDINANETSRGMRKNTPTTTSRPKTVNTTSSADPLQEPSSSTAPSLGKERVSKTVRINIEECKDPPDTRPSSSRYRTGVGGTLLETAPRRPGLERGEAKYKEKRRSISGGPGNILTPMVKRKREFSQSKKHMNRFSLGSGYYASTEPVSLASAIPSSPDARLWQLVRLPARPHSVFIPSSPRTYHGAGSGGIKDNKEPKSQPSGAHSSSLSASPSSSSRSGRKPRPLSQLQAAFNPRQSLSFLIGSKSDSPVGMYPGSHSSSESLLPKDRRATNSQTSGSSNSVKVIDNRLRKDLNGSYEGNGSSAGSSSSSKALSRNTLPGSLSAKVNGTLTAAAAAVNSITTATTSTWKRNSSMILFPFSLVTYETGGMLGEFKTSTSPCSGSAIICTNKASPLVAPGTVLPPGAVVSTGIPPPATTPSGSLSIASNSPTISTITTTTTKAKRVSGILPPIPAISVTPSSKSSRVLLSASSLSLLAGSMTGLNQRMGDDMVRIKCEDTDEDLDSMASNMDVAGDLVTDEEEQREDEDEGEGEGEEEGRARVKTVEYEAQVAKAGAVDHLPAHGDHPKVLLPQLETMVTLEQPLPDHYNTYEVKIEDEEGLVLQRSHVAVYEINARWGSRLIMLLVTIGGLFCVLGGGNCARHHCRDLQLCPSFGDMWMQQDNADRNLGAWCGPSGLEGAPYMLSVGLSMSVFGIYALVHLQSPISRLVGYSGKI